MCVCVFFFPEKTLSNAVFKLTVICDEVQKITENELPFSSRQKPTGFASDHTCFLQVQEIRPEGKSEQK